jgi:hypothetical protein
MINRGNTKSGKRIQEFSYRPAARFRLEVGRILRISRAWVSRLLELFEFFRIWSRGD